MQAAKQVQCNLEYTTLHKVTAATEIYYDPDPTVCLWLRFPCHPAFPISEVHLQLTCKSLNECVEPPHLRFDDVAAL